MQRRAAEESLTDHGKDNSNGRAHVGDAIRHKPGILGFLRQIGFMGATGAAGTAEPARAGRLRAGHRSAAVPGPDDPRQGPPARPAPRRARHPGEQALERVRRPLPLSRIQDPGRRPDALRRPRPRRLAARHARLLHRRVEARPARQLHRMDTATAREGTFPSWSTTRDS